MDDHIVQSNGTDKTESGEVASGNRLISSLKNGSVETDQSLNSQKARKKNTKSEKINKFSCKAPAEIQLVPLVFKKPNHKEISGKKFHKVYRQSDESAKQDNPAISDARLRAYGINPKRFKNKLKYGKK